MIHSIFGQTVVREILALNVQFFGTLVALDVEPAAVAIVPIDHARAEHIFTAPVNIGEVHHRVGIVFNCFVLNLIVDILAQMTLTGMVVQETKRCRTEMDVEMILIITIISDGEVLVRLGPAGTIHASVGFGRCATARGVIVGVVLVAGREGEHCGCHKEQHSQFFDLFEHV